MSDPLDLKTFLFNPGVILDVRSPGEYTQGHIPGAINLPLFNDSERASVGTTYKTKGHEEAVELGLKFAGPKLSEFVQHAKKFVGTGVAKVHCWRGGMRSSSMAWLLRTAGLKAVTLNGGYKSFRKWVLDIFSETRSINIIGGLTGSGKSSILQIMKESGEQILDLEYLAKHRGSSFGMIGMPRQPTVEQFENELAMQWASFDSKYPIWIEDESRRIGTCTIPHHLFNQMMTAPMFLIERPFLERVQHLIDVYGCAPKDELILATQRISKRIGGERTQEVIQYLEEGLLEKAVEVILKYYDATYQYGITRRHQPIFYLQGESLSNLEWVKKISQKYREVSDAKET